jgi:hypothetical protein
VGAVLTFLIKAGFRERLNTVATRYPGQLGHTATSSVSK